MKVLVVGSLNYIDDVATRSRFEQVCREIGVAAAIAGFEFIVGSSSTNPADKHALEGAASVPGTHRVSIYHQGKGEALGLPAVDGTKTAFVVSHKRLKGPRAANRLPQLQAADAVVLIGGAKGTAQIGYAAIALGKPALAIGCFHGAAVHRQV